MEYEKWCMHCSRGQTLVIAEIRENPIRSFVKVAAWKWLNYVDSFITHDHQLFVLKELE